MNSANLDINIIRLYFVYLLSLAVNVENERFCFFFFSVSIGKIECRSEEMKIEEIIIMFYYC